MTTTLPRPQITATCVTYRRPATCVHSRDWNCATPMTLRLHPLNHACLGGHPTSSCCGCCLPED